MDIPAKKQMIGHKAVLLMTAKNGGNLKMKKWKSESKEGKLGNQVQETCLKVITVEVNYS
jgi:hypothetical protein